MPTSTSAARTRSTGDPAPGGEIDDGWALADGSWLGEFQIIRTLGVGGFGIVYLALDTALQREVAIKEYMPSSLARRGRSARVEARTSAPAFAAGLESFLYEARLLASFDHPALVKVHRFWEANQTAYMAMRYYPGRTLKDERSRMAAPPDERWLRGVIAPLLEALELLHRAGVYHRDISPDNILLLPDGAPVLLDFGSARQVISDRTQALTAILKPNFAPVEQYADVPGLRQGPWTDLYALGAVVHYMLTGKAPLPSVVRTMDDTLPRLCGADPGRYPGVGSGFLAAIDWALQVTPQARPQSVAALRQAIDAAAPIAAGALALPGHARSSVDLSPSPDAPRLPEAAQLDSQWVVTTSIAAPKADADANANVGRVGSPAALGAGAPAWHRRSMQAGLVGLAVCVAALVAYMSGAIRADPQVAAAVTGAQLQGQAQQIQSQPAQSLQAQPHPQPQEHGQSKLPQAPQSKPPVQAVAGAAPPSAADPPVTAHARPPIRRSTLPSEHSIGSGAAALQVKSAAVQAASGEAGPEGVCGGRNFLSRSACIRRECSTTRFREHPQCLKLQREEEARLRGEIAH